jgi:XTP/dITP diphosphohydrolase
MKLCFATNNKHKLEEVRNVIDHQIEILSLNELSVNEELPENHDTLEKNSLQKAHYVFHRTGHASFADDSGLEVESLNGAPGVYSARYAGPQRSDDDNINLLLKNLNGSNNRRARFRTVVALVGCGEPKLFEGVLNGVIIETKRGSNGFGYDSVFQPDGHSRTLAEMTLGEKNHISHRSIAMRSLIDYLKLLANG